MSISTHPAPTTWSTPAARLLLPAGAPEDQWLAARLAGIGGTDAATLAGANKYQTPYGMWSEKTGHDAPDDSSKADLFWWGHEVEPIIARRFEAETGLTCRRVGMLARKDAAHHYANIDRLVSDGGILEIKSTGPYTEAAKVWRSGGVPEHALVQAQWGLHVSGRTHAWFAAVVDRTPFIVGPVDRDDALIFELVRRADEMWALVAGGTPPPMDLSTVTADELSVRHPAVLDPDSTVEASIPELVIDDVTRLAEIKAGTDEMTAERTAIETRLKAQIGDREYLTVGGRPVVRWQQVAGRKSLDTKALRKSHPDLADEYTRQAAPTRRLSLIQSGEQA